MKIGQDIKSVTIPWGKGRSVPADKIETEIKVRQMIDELTEGAREQLSYDSARLPLTGSRELGSDLDPTIGRVLRSNRSGDYIAAECQNSEKGSFTPKKFLIGEAGEGVHTKATWSDSGIDKAERLRQRGKPDEWKESIEVNSNGTLTYSWGLTET